MIQTDRNFQFGNTEIESEGMVELLLPTPGHIQDIPILHDAVDLHVPALLRFEVLDRNNLFFDNLTGIVCYRVTTRQHQIKYEYR